MVLSRKIVPLIFLALLLAGLTRSYFSNQLFRSHDMEAHASRVANYYLSLKDGQFPPRWAPNLNYGFGFPLFNYVYPLPYLTSALTYSLTNSIQISINIIMASSILMAGTGIYLYAHYRTRYHNPGWGPLVAAILYCSAPYFLLNHFIRGALGEAVFLGLLPWVMLLIEWRKKANLWWFPVLSIPIFSSFLLSHQLALTIAIPFLLGWLWIEIRPHLGSATKWLKMFLVCLLCAVLISQFFWTPLIFEKNLTRASSESNLQKMEGFISPWRLIWSKWEYSQLGVGAENGETFSQMLGPGTLAVVFWGTIHLWRKKERISIHKAYWFGILLSGIFLTQKMSAPIWDNLEVLRYQQFPWRLLWVCLVAATFLFIELIRDSKPGRILSLFVFSTIIISGIWAVVWWAKPVAYFSTPDYFWFEFPDHLMAKSELLPKTFDSHKNLALSDPLALRLSDGGVVPINPPLYSWSGTQMKYHLSLEEKTEILQRTAYFPGWEVRINKQIVPINFDDQQFPGRIIYEAEVGEHDIEVSFTQNTPARFVGNSLSLFGLLLASVIIFIQLLNLSRHNKIILT